MNRCHKFIYFVGMFQILTQNVLSENATRKDFSDDTKLKDSDGRRSGSILILGNSGKSSDGQRITSHKIETKIYTTRVTSGSSGSGGLQGWVSRSQADGNVVFKPQIQGIVQSQGPCALPNNALTNTGGQASIVQKKSTLESTQTFNGGCSLHLASNENQRQANQKGIRVGSESLVMGQLGGQTTVFHGSSSTTNTMNDVTGSLLTSQGVKNIHEGTDDIQKQETMFYPDNDSYKVSITTSGDGIYANELTGQQTENVNVMVKPEANSLNIVAVPVMRPQVGQSILQGYRPNIQYYLRQIESSNIIKNPAAILQVPSFIERIKPDQMYINLSEDQLNSYRQYLIQTGLIKLKPYQLIFSDQLRPKLRTLQWMAVPLESNEEYCRQRCGGLFARNTLYSSITENAAKLPIKLLVPVLRIGSGLRKSVARVQTAGDITGVFRTTKNSPSQVPGSDESKKQN